MKKSGNLFHQQDEIVKEKTENYFVPLICRVTSYWLVR